MTISPDVLEEVGDAVLAAHKAVTIEDPDVYELGEAVACLSHGLQVLLDAMTDRTALNGNRVAMLAERCRRIDAAL